MVWRAVGPRVSDSVREGRFIPKQPCRMPFAQGLIQCPRPAKCLPKMLPRLTVKAWRSRRKCLLARRHHQIHQKIPRVSQRPVMWKPCMATPIPKKMLRVGFPFPKGAQRYTTTCTSTTTATTTLSCSGQKNTTTSTMSIITITIGTFIPSPGSPKPTMDIRRCFLALGHSPSLPTPALNAKIKMPKPVPKLLSGVTGNMRGVGQNRS